MKILVTGGCGFQGSHLVKKLLEEDNEATILNTFSEQAERNSKRFKLAKRGKFNLVWGSVTDAEIVEKTVREQDVIIHMAARINVDESIKNPSDFINVNIKGTFNILEAAKKYGCSMIYVSSCEVYGENDDGKISEHTLLNPKSPYAASKAGADRLCWAYWKTYGTKVVIVRPFNIFGEGQKEDEGGGAVIPIFVKRVMDGKPLYIFGDGSQTRDYMYIDDVIEGYMMILENLDDLYGRVINFGTGKGTSVRKIAEYIVEKMGKGKIEFKEARSGEVRGFACDFSLANTLLGWNPKTTIFEGIDKYIKWRTIYYDRGHNGGLSKIT